MVSRAENPDLFDIASVVRLADRMIGYHYRDTLRMAGASKSRNEGGVERDEVCR